MTNQGQLGEVIKLVSEKFAEIAIEHFEFNPQLEIKFDAVTKACTLEVLTKPSDISTPLRPRMLDQLKLRLIPLLAPLDYGYTMGLVIDGHDVRCDMTINVYEVFQRYEQTTSLIKDVTFQEW